MISQNGNSSLSCGTDQDFWSIDLFIIGAIMVELFIGFIIYEKYNFYSGTHISQCPLWLVFP